MIQNYLHLGIQDNAEKALNLVDSVFPHESIEHWTYKASIFKRLTGDLNRAIECRSKLIDDKWGLSEEDNLQNISVLIKWDLDSGRKSEAEKLIQHLEKFKSNFSGSLYILMAS